MTKDTLRSYSYPWVNADLIPSHGPLTRYNPYLERPYPPIYTPTSPLPY